MQRLGVDRWALVAAVAATVACAPVAGLGGGAEPARSMARTAGDFVVVETTIDEVHQAMLEGRLTARALVDAYLARIEAYDKQGPAINSLITVHPRAREIADSLDALLAATGRLSGPLHGIPFIVKDNYDTFDLPTTGASLALEGLMPPDDAFQVRRVREAGGIVLAKANLAEFAFTALETVDRCCPAIRRTRIVSTG